MKFSIIFLSIAVFLFTCTTLVHAAIDPQAVPNNTFGVHILFPTEVEQAARIVNSGGGDWGYVTIPIQSGDKNMLKWQKFMDDCRKFHLIPIVRLATEGDYFNTSAWRKPQLSDVLDFANFLSSLTWPTQIHYIVVYNEVNRNDEWGGKADPLEYATTLAYAVQVFKAKDPQSFILSAGLDNAATDSNSALSEYEFIQNMNSAVPGIFNQIDGFASHSYPNPGFSSSPEATTQESIRSFSFEENLIDKLSSRKLPIFITETGWSRNTLSDTTIAEYYQIALTGVWNDSRIVAVTPFLLQAVGAPFEQFSLLTSTFANTPVATALQEISKKTGKPLLTPNVLAAETVIAALPVKRFSPVQSNILLQGYHFIRSLVQKTYAVVR